MTIGRLILGILIGATAGCFTGAAFAYPAAALALAGWQTTADVVGWSGMVIAFLVALFVSFIATSALRP